MTSFIAAAWVLESSSPPATFSRWGAVLAAHPQLRVNLGHFGGFIEKETINTESPRLSGWALEALGLMERFPNLYADVSNFHSLIKGTAKYRVAVARMVEREMTASPWLAHRLMHGSDWHMIQPSDGDGIFVERVEQVIPDARRAAVMGGNALRFLGFGRGVAGANRKRVGDFYMRYGMQPPAWFAATA